MEHPIHPYQPQPLAGQVAIVTGAGSGIGRAEALELARAGAKVVVNDLRRERAEQVADEINAAGGEALASPLSVTTLENGAAIVGAAVEAFGRLDILVNNAGIGARARVEEMTEKSWDLITAVNLKGSFAVIRAAVPILKRQKYGVIVNTSSESGLGINYFCGYAASKEGVIGLTRALAFELAPFNIRCNAIRPRAFDTGMSDPTKFDRYLEFEKRFGRAAIGQHRMSHIAFPRSQEVGAVVAWLCTDDAREMTGRNLIVGGGEIALMSEPMVERSCFRPEGWTPEALTQISTYLCADTAGAARGFSPEARLAIDQSLAPGTL